MTTHESSQALSPSDYIARHLHNFSTPSTPSPASAAAGHHLGFFVWTPYGLILAGGLFVVLACFAAFRDRGAPFSFDRRMTFGQRLYLWWSCAWRQWLASTLLFAVVLLVFYFLILRKAPSLMQFSANLVPHDLASRSPGWSVAIAASPAIAALLIYSLVNLPLAGYMVRSGLAAHAMGGPAHFGFWHATLLGLTTYVWAAPGSLVIADVVVSLPFHAEDLLYAIFIAAWGMYIVLPRQVRRVQKWAKSA
ncbi:hypothetical protein [Paraburkholderia susongensis]|uniref:Uncharacterized protein n=1 Tax=Paraburkholderia susongensis TaxID=1515439 RepID=A0A1X7LXD5_9BURK|nr:hypothetical protein [Paraburkholderia susongensis]SMG58360.1 hypothetical protein SAMN06265784_11131 [Paraburkholderia susongensis]